MSLILLLGKKSSDLLKWNKTKKLGLLQEFVVEAFPVEEYLSEDRNFSIIFSSKKRTKHFIGYFSSSRNVLHFLKELLR